jgi:hypothetical protein
LSGKKHVKAAEKLKKSAKKPVKSQDVIALINDRKEEKKEKNRLVAIDEAFIMRYAKELDQVIQDTKANVERKQSRTYEEREVCNVFP